MATVVAVTFDAEAYRAQEPMRQLAAFHELLGRIGLSTGKAGEWWNLQTYPELGDRTPTEAWLAGDHEGVEKLLRSWHDDSSATVERVRSDPERIRRIEQRRRELAARRG